MTSLAKLLAQTKEELANKLFNMEVARWADQREDDPNKTGNGKCIPYIGWHWRDADFAGKCISIGKAEGYYIGVMENNKWGYPERLMTEAEVDTFIDYLERAFAEMSKDGDLEVLRKNAFAIFAEMRTWFQSLEIRGEQP